MKTIFILLIFLSTTQLFAQEDEMPVGLQGQPVLPEQGDIGLGVNLIPFFYWFGNSFNSNSNNTYAGDNKFFSIFGNSVIVGKYMLTDRTAFRWAWGLNFGHADEDKYVQDDASNNPDVMVKDSRSTDWSMASLSLGWEMRRGKGRFQGFWGVDGVITYDQSNDWRYYYGNGYSATNHIPTAYDWGTNLNNNKRRTKDTGYNVLGIGVRGFIGAEYFVAPKLAIGAEFGWGLMFRHTLAITISEEYYEPSTGNVISEDNFIGSTNAFTAGVENMNGTIYMSFFFDSECGKKGGGTAKSKPAKPAKGEKPAKKTKTKKSNSIGNGRF